MHGQLCGLAGRAPACMLERPSRQRRQPARQAVQPVAGLVDVIRSIFDFDSWAPRSSRTWRRTGRPTMGEAQLKAAAEAEEREERAEQEELMMAQLQRRVGELGGSSSSSLDEGSEAVAGGAGGGSDLAPSMDDGDLSASFNRRMQQLQGGGDGSGEASPSGSGQGGEDAPGMLTGAELRAMIANKYQRQHDMQIVRRDMPGKTLIRLNVMWSRLEQASFPMSESEYDDKLDVIAFYLRAWGQEAQVREFFSQPPRAMRGLPARPVVGSAVSIRLELTPEQIAEYFPR